MFQAIYSFIGTILDFFSGIMGGSYLLGLLIFALLIKVILLPFGIKQQKNSIRQAKLKPKEEAIRKKYKGRDDKVTQQKMQTELSEMYQTEGYNPMGGCLPMILQMVIILLLWQAILYPLQYVVKMDKSTISAVQSYITAPVDYETKTIAGVEGADGKISGLGITLGKNNYRQIDVLKNLNEIDKNTFEENFRAFLEDPDLATYMTEAYGADASNNAVFLDFCTVDNTAAQEGKSYFVITNNKGEETKYTLYDPEKMVADAVDGMDDLPNFDLFGMRNFLADVPSLKSLITFPWTTEVLLVLIPLLNFFATLATGKITKKLMYQPMQNQQAGGCSPALMDWFAPAMTLVIAFGVPAAIGMYWLFNNLLGVLQQFILHKACPLPKFTEEDYKAAERELAGKAPKDRPAGYSSSGPARSLYLEDFDDDDAAQTPVVGDDDDDDDVPSNQNKNTVITPAKPKDSGSDKKNNKYE